MKREEALKANAPRPYDLSDPTEIKRLLRECYGYLRTCQNAHHGTDVSGRQYAIEALHQYADGRPTPIPPSAPETGAEAKPVAWRYRYIHRSKPSRWVYTQACMESQPADSFYAAVEAEPLYTADALASARAAGAEEARKGIVEKLRAERSISRTNWRYAAHRFADAIERGGDQT